MTNIEKIKKYYPTYWNKETVDEILRRAKITVAEYLTLFPFSDDRVVDSETMALLKEGKLSELRNECNQRIECGIDVKTSNSGDTTEHFSLDSYDQNNISNMFYSVMAGVKEYPYHADGKKCAMYTKEDIISIYVAAQNMITYHTTRYNMFRTLVNRTEYAEELAAITYDSEFPEDLAAVMDENILTAQKELEKITNTLDNN